MQRFSALNLSGPTQDDRTWAVLSYVGAICFFCGLPSLLIFLLKRGESAYIRQHSLQAFVFSLLWLVFFSFALFLSIFRWINLPFCFLLILLPVAYWGLLIVQAYRGDDHRLPLLGNLIASRFANEY